MFEVVLFAIGVLMVVFAFVVTANQNFKSKLIFNILPFFGGMYIIWYAASVLGYIHFGVL